MHGQAGATSGQFEIISLPGNSEASCWFMLSGKPFIFDEGGIRDASRNIVLLIYLEFVDDILAVIGRAWCLF
jgi:hypothetical protein